MTPDDIASSRAILAAATQGTWIAVPRTSQHGMMLGGTGPTLSHCGDAQHATSLRLDCPGSLGDMAVAEVRMPWEQHAANAKAAAHAVNTLPVALDALEALRKAITDSAEHHETRARELREASEWGAASVCEAQANALRAVLGGGQ